MSEREMNLSENIEPNESSQKIDIPDLNEVYMEDEAFMEDETQIGGILLESNSNTGSYPSLSQIPLPIPLPFDLNDEPCMEDTSVGDILPESNLNLELDGGANQNPTPPGPQISMSTHLAHDTYENMPDDVVTSEIQEMPSRKKLCNADRRAIYDALLDKSVGGKLVKGVLANVASQFSVSTRTIQRIWTQGKNNGVHADVSHKMTNAGRKRVEIDFTHFREIPLRQRTTIRSLACAIDMSKSTLHRRVKSKEVRRHSNAIKPFLKEENKRSRLQFCISMLDGASLPHDPIFSGMYNTIHIDEKWFYMTKKCENYYLLHDEEEPLRTCKSKNFIEKVMFLVAIARPRFDAQGNTLFSGKIGEWPLVTHEPAKRTSVNRPAGTLETKPITSITKQVIRTYLLEKVLPAIKEKWPREEIGSPIFIQQDNARTHIDCDDPEFRRVASQDGFDIRLKSQPANSPDLNVLDLGFFSAIQSLQHKESPNSVDELVHAVKRSFETFSVVKSNRIFLTLQLCMIEIMKTRGSHKYKIPHLKKEMLERQGQLPMQLKCDPTMVQDVLHYLESFHS